MIIAKTRQEAAVEALREAIVDGVYVPGEPLRQQELARRLGCSVIPIREALHQLAAEGGSLCMSGSCGCRLRDCR